MGAGGTGPPAYRDTGCSDTLRLVTGFTCKSYSEMTGYSDTLLIVTMANSEDVTVSR